MGVKLLKGYEPWKISALRAKETLSYLAQYKGLRGLSPMEERMKLQAEQRLNMNDSDALEKWGKARRVNA